MPKQTDKQKIEQARSRLERARRVLNRAKENRQRADDKVGDAQWALALVLWPHQLDDPREASAFSRGKPYTCCSLCGLADWNCKGPCGAVSNGQSAYHL